MMSLGDQLLLTLMKLRLKQMPEVAVSNKERLDMQCHMYNQYKGRTTLKALIGVA